MSSLELFMKSSRLLTVLRPGSFRLTRETRVQGSRALVQKTSPHDRAPVVSYHHAIGDNTMSFFPVDPPRIRQRIRRYERLLAKEVEDFDRISDGYGKRYLLGPLYMLLGDVDGALASYRWFEATFPHDVGHPMHLLCWSLALYRSGQEQAAARKLRRLIQSNSLILPRLLDGKSPDLSLDQDEHIRKILELEDVPPEIYALWDEAALTWARAVGASPAPD